MNGVIDHSLTPPHDCSKTEFLGLYFDTYNETRALTELTILTGKSSFSYVITPNVDHMVGLASTTDTMLGNAYAQADMTLCDSRILSLLAQKSGIALSAVPGSDLTRQLLKLKNASWRCAVVGGDAKLHSHITQLYPQHIWAFHQPPMGVRRNQKAKLEIAEFVENADADIIFFAIGAPQSEICCFDIKQRGHARGVALCIGASLEFLTGAKKRAPLWMQRSSLEWLHRLSSEPQRLWRRYLLEGPKIFLIWRRWHIENTTRRHVGSGSTRFDEQ
jgi:exopolysaccharide biosynthesis WecB/TagA/CpsF family protein